MSKPSQSIDLTMHNDIEKKDERFDYSTRALQTIPTLKLLPHPDWKYSEDMAARRTWMIWKTLLARSARRARRTWMSKRAKLMIWNT